MVSDLPNLLLVHNRASPTKLSSEEMTAQFFKTHDPKKKLLDYFSSIICVSIPQHSTDHPEQFWCGVEVLGKQLCELLEKSRCNQLEKSNLITSQTWSSLLIMIIDRFHGEEVLRLGPLLTSVITKDLPDQMLRSIFDFYRTAFLIQSRECWDKARLASMNHQAGYLTSSCLLKRVFSYSWNYLICSQGLM